MIAKTRCGGCRTQYELIWDDSITDSDNWDYDDEEEEEMPLTETDGDPVFCPFCGTHIDYLE